MINLREEIAKFTDDILLIIATENTLLKDEVRIATAEELIFRRIK